VILAAIEVARNRVLVRKQFIDDPPSIEAHFAVTKTKNKWPPMNTDEHG
jgi:hypothetical protein